MAIDMFLKLDNVKGESVDSKHAGEIDLNFFEWGASQSGTMHKCSGGGAGKVSVKDLSIIKYVDRATPILILACCSGKHFREAVLTVRKAGDKPLEYLKITMKDVLVSLHATGGNDGSDRQTENVSFNFAEFKIEYTPQKADGSGDAEVETSFNIAQNTSV